MPAPRMIVFLLVASTLWGLLHLYVGLRLLGPFELDGSALALAWCAVAVMWSIAPAAMVVGRTPALRGKSDAFTAIGFASMGFFLVLFPLVVFRDVAWITVRGADLLWAAMGSGTLLPDEAHRRLLLAASNVAIGAIAIAIVGFGYLRARGGPKVVSVEVPIRGLPDAFDGYRIAQISDVHVSPGIREPFVARIVAKVNALEADMVAVTGDLVDGFVRDLRDDAAPLSGITSRDGVFFVTGNHEYYWQAREWIDEVRRLGMTPLVNEHRVIERDGARLVIAGVTDTSAHQMIASHRTDPAGAIEGTRGDDVKILLAHQPKSIEAARRLGYHLQLSGHTHGGQFFPWNFFVGLVHPIAVGLGKFDETWVYVNRGTGYWGPPNRAGVPSEISHITLRRA